MPITKTFAQGKLRLSDVLASVSRAGLLQLNNNLFPMARRTKFALASKTLLQPRQCPDCKTELGTTHELYSRIAVCDHCGYHFVWSASNRIEHLADPGSLTRLRPEGFRKAIRMMELAAQLRCPLVTLVDTSGADPGDESEKHGIAWSLAHCLSMMSHLPVPVLTAIIGEGSSGGAVAFAVADHILMLQNAIYEVISPEGAATILYRDAQQARKVAEQLKLTAFDCLQLGIIDAIIPEPLLGAHTDPPMVMQALQQHLLHAITKLEKVPVKQLLARRYRKFRQHGRFQRRWRYSRKRSIGELMTIIGQTSALVQASALRHILPMPHGSTLGTTIERWWWHHA